MWPFKKADTRPRILLVDAWRQDGSLDISVRRVDRVANYFVMTKYSIESEVFILEPGGTFRSKPKMNWEKIDDIPGLTDQKAEGLAERPPSGNAASTTDHTHDDTGR